MFSAPGAGASHQWTSPSSELNTAAAMFVERGDASALLPSCTAAAPRLPPFGSLGFSMSSRSKPKPFLEPRTGVEYPAESCFKKGHCPVVVGAGPRTKRIAGIKSLDIYAVGLYVNSDATRSALHGKFKSETADSLPRNQRFWDELVRADGVEKTLRIVITSRMITRDKFLHALAERLEAPLKKVGDLPSLDAFKAQFGDVHLRKGICIALTSAGGQLITQVDGKQMGAITSKPLAHEMFRMYLGSAPVSEVAKTSFAKGLADIVLA